MIFLASTEKEAEPRSPRRTQSSLALAAASAAAKEQLARRLR